MTSNCIGDFAHWERVVSLISICNCCIYHSFVQNHLFVFNFCHTFLRFSWFIRFHQKSREKNKSEVWLGANSFEDTFSFLFLSWNFSSYLHFAPFVKLPTFYHLYDEEIDVLFSCKSLYIGQDIVKETVGAFSKIKIKKKMIPFCDDLDLCLQTDERGHQFSRGQSMGEWKKFVFGRKQSSYSKRGMMR